MPVERIDKIITTVNSDLSRSQARMIIRKGKVCVNGKTVKDFSLRCDTGKDIITLNGSRISYRKHVYIMMNKPVGVLSASTDKSRETVVSLLPPDLFRDGISPAGRLDKDTTGLLILSNDGDFIHRVISPKNHVSKEYIAVLDRLPDENAAEAFKNGVTLADGKKCLTAGYEVISAEPPTVRIILTQGMFHQVKRMLGTVNAGVIALKRIRTGGLLLDKTLLPGESRELTATELESIFNGS